MPNPTPRPPAPRRPFRDADEADVFRALKRPGSGAALQRQVTEEAMRAAAGQ